MISSATDLTSEWMTELLRSTGDIDDSVSVTGVVAEEFGSAESMMSSLLRLTIAYDGPTDAPSSLIAKLASQNEGMLFVAGMFKFYEREVRFYNELLAQAGIDAPRCLHAEMYGEGEGFLLLLEEVAGRRQVDQIEGMNFDDAKTTIEVLADLHASFFGTDLSELAETMFPFGTELMQQLIPGKTADDWSKARSRVADDLPAEVVDLLDRWMEFAPRMMDDLMGQDTLVHGDCRADNVLFDEDGGVLVLDFQLMTICNGMFDIAYLISQSLDEDTQARAGELIDAYLAAMAAKGIELDVDQAMASYKASTVFNLAIPLGTLAAEGLHERSVQLGHTMIERAAKEILRVGAHLPYA